MKLNSLMLIAALAASVMCGTNVRAQRNPPPTPPVPSAPPQTKIKHIEKTEKSEKTKVKVTKTVEREERLVAVEPDVVITLCMASGRVSVRGTDRNEVRAELPQNMKIDFRRADGTDNDTPAKRLEVLVAESSDEDEGEDEGKDKDKGESTRRFGQCRGSGDFELEVPRNATLFFKSDSADFDIDTIAEAHVETQSGNISLRHVVRATEATSIDGDVSLENSSGRVRLESFGGSVAAINVSKSAEGDFFRAKSISNDVALENVSHSRVEVTTISGEITMRGMLARAGVYDLRTTSGDITLTMPVDSSFKLTAKVSASGEIVTDFPLKYTGGISTSTSLSSGRMIGIYGTGDATINLISFSGTLRLRKQ